MINEKTECRVAKIDPVRADRKLSVKKTSRLLI